MVDSGGAGWECGLEMLDDGGWREILMLQMQVDDDDDVAVVGLFDAVDR